MDRREAIAALLTERGRLLVVTGLGSSSYDVNAAGDHDANFYLWGAMGSAALTGMGLALAQPQLPVAVITGDGEQLMGLGGLATIATTRPGNLSIVVVDNGHFGETGMQQSHTGQGLQLHRVAAACGFPETAEVVDLAGVAALRPVLQKLSGGPRLITLKVAANSPPRSLPPRDGVFLKNRIRAHLGFPPN
jgi:thiamine pyrophosphate-dependent acetolactate synthase large subunit-like protein